jgi:pimeloyl-ACP methyl ester carboxylesterase
MSGSWTTVDITGKRADVYEPLIGRAQFAVLHLHGADMTTLRDRPAFTRYLDEFHLPCVCPHGQAFWWADRVCPHFDPRVSPERYLLDSVLPFFKQKWSLNPPAIGLQGIGMGGQGALRLAFKHPKLFPVVAAVAPVLEYHHLYGWGTALDTMYDSKEQCRQDTAIMHVPPSHPPPYIFFSIPPDDPRWYRGADRLHEKLKALGVEHEIDFTTGAGRLSWDYFDHMAEHVERYVYSGLQEQSRGLL